MEDLSGRAIGSYKLLNRIGMGGLAAVYRAYHASMDRYVAIKSLPREFAQDPGFVGRFEQEARIIAKLEHRHILPVYDYGEHAGIAYLVMRLVDGGTLKDKVGLGALEVYTALRLVTQIAEALEAASGGGQTALIDGCFAGLMLGASEVGRSLLLVFSDGVDTASYLSAESVIARRG